MRGFRPPEAGCSPRRWRQRSLKLAPLLPNRIHRRDHCRRRLPNFGRQGIPLGPVVGVSVRIVSFSSYGNKPRDHSLVSEAAYLGHPAMTRCGPGFGGHPLGYAAEILGYFVF